MWLVSKLFLALFLIQGFSHVDPCSLNFIPHRKNVPSLGQKEPVKSVCP